MSQLQNASPPLPRGLCLVVQQFAHFALQRLSQFVEPAGTPESREVTGQTNQQRIRGSHLTTVFLPPNWLVPSWWWEKNSSEWAMMINHGQYMSSYDSGVSFFNLALSPGPFPNMRVTSLSALPAQQSYDSGWFKRFPTVDCKESCITSM